MRRTPWLVWLTLMVLSTSLCVVFPQSIITKIAFLVIGFSFMAVFITWEGGLIDGEPHENSKTWLDLAFWGRRPKDDFCCDVCKRILEGKDPYNDQ